MQHTDNPTETFHIEFNRCLDLVSDDTNVARRFALLFTLDKIATAHYDSLAEEHRLIARLRQQYADINTLQTEINTNNEDLIKTLTRLGVFQSAVIILLMIITIIT